MDPLEQMQPAPESPVSPPGVTGTPELSQDEMRKNLQYMMAKIDASYQDFNTQKFSSANKVQDQRSQLLRDLFDLLQSMGVDPSIPEEVKAFLDKIKQENPELYQQIEESLQTLLGEEVAPVENGEIPQTNMNINKYENPPQNI